MICFERELNRQGCCSNWPYGFDRDAAALFPEPGSLQAASPERPSDIFSCVVKCREVLVFVPDSENLWSHICQIFLEAWIQWRCCWHVSWLKGRMEVGNQWKSLTRIGG